MPCTYTIYKDKRLVVTTASEVFTFAEAMAHEDKIYTDADFDPTFVHLIDATAITRTEITASEISTLARRTRFSPKSRKALVANSTLLFGLARMFPAAGAAPPVDNPPARGHLLSYRLTPCSSRAG